MKARTLLIVAITCLTIQIACGQNNRLKTKNTIGWYNYFGTIKLSKKIALHTEYQWRRTHVITSWQQGLLRFGLNYTLNPRVLVRIGYAWAETFPYGEYPINGLGREFTEHRIYEMIQLAHKEGALDFSHRFMLEQRFVGRYSSAAVAKEDEFPLLHRIRYMGRLQMPFKGKEIKDKTAYMALYDEIFVGFGKNVNANVFDQNRLGVLLGYRFNQHLRMEAGYLNQIVQLGRQINSKNVFQYNQGLILNAHLNIDLSGKPRALK